MLYPHAANAESLRALSIIPDGSSIHRAITTLSNSVRGSTDMGKTWFRFVDGIVELK